MKARTAAILSIPALAVIVGVIIGSLASAPPAPTPPSPVDTSARELYLIEIGVNRPNSSAQMQYVGPFSTHDACEQRIAESGPYNSRLKVRCRKFIDPTPDPEEPVLP